MTLSPEDRNLIRRHMLRIAAGWLVGTSTFTGLSIAGVVWFFRDQAYKEAFLSALKEFNGYQIEEIKKTQEKIISINETMSRYKSQSEEAAKSAGIAKENAIKNAELVEGIRVQQSNSQAQLAAKVADELMTRHSDRIVYDITERATIRLQNAETSLKNLRSWKVVTDKRPFNPSCDYRVFMPPILTSLKDSREWQITPTMIGESQMTILFYAGKDATDEGQGFQVLSDRKTRALPMRGNAAAEQPVWVYERCENLSLGGP